jgi:tRNA(Arg) A34 adenosine deaminase TadA
LLGSSTIRVPPWRRHPWPVTDDELVLTDALEKAIAAYCEAGPSYDARIREAAANLILEAFNRGLRDQNVLAHHALKSLRRGRLNL